MDHEGVPIDPLHLPQATAHVEPEETLVADNRADIRPAQMVERKLVSLLKHTPLPLSRLQTVSGRRPPV